MLQPKVTFPHTTPKHSSLEKGSEYLAHNFGHAVGELLQDQRDVSMPEIKILNGKLFWTSANVPLFISVSVTNRGICYLWFRATHYLLITLCIPLFLLSSHRIVIAIGKLPSYNQTSVQFRLEEIDCHRNRSGITFLLTNIHQVSYGNTIAPLLAFTDLRTITGQHTPHHRVHVLVYSWFVQNPLHFQCRPIAELVRNRQTGKYGLASLSCCQMRSLCAWERHHVVDFRCCTPWLIVNSC